MNKRFNDICKLKMKNNRAIFKIINNFVIFLKKWKFIIIFRDKKLKVIKQKMYQNK